MCVREAFKGKGTTITEIPEKVVNKRIHSCIKCCLIVVKTLASILVAATLTASQIFFMITTRTLQP